MSEAAWIVAVGLAVTPMLVIAYAVRSRAEADGRQSILPSDQMRRLEIASAAAWSAPTVVLTTLLVFDKPFETALFGMFVAFALTLNAYLGACLISVYRRRRP